jgi:hypothetical protein
MWTAPPEDSEISKASLTRQVDAIPSGETDTELLAAQSDKRGSSAVSVAPVKTIVTMGVDSLLNLGSGHLPLAAALLNSSPNALYSTNPESLLHQLQSLRNSAGQATNESLLGMLGLVSSGVRAPT